MSPITILFLIIMALLIIWRMGRGFKKGIVKELSDTVSLFIALIAGQLLYSGYQEFMLKHVSQIVCKLATLAIVVVIYKVLSIIFSALKIFASLPILKYLDKLLGLVIGFVEGVMIIIFILFWLKGIIT